MGPLGPIQLNEPWADYPHPFSILHSHPTTQPAKATPACLQSGFPHAWPMPSKGLSDLALPAHRL